MRGWLLALCLSVVLSFPNLHTLFSLSLALIVFLPFCLEGRKKAPAVQKENRKHQTADLHTEKHMHCAHAAPNNVLVEFTPPQLLTYCGCGSNTVPHIDCMVNGHLHKSWPVG